ncbi:MAG: peptidoglycan DD-metalloendopeptidase family protein [Candidatus Saccharibacteria bacterium]|nr:peptidoglycan DD-metalloendopeptidase family protein [Candidatus Saccharibacteria bacterium]
MLRSTVIQIYVLLGLILVSILLLPIVFLIIVSHQSIAEVEQALVKDQETYVELLDVNGQIVTTLPKNDSFLNREQLVLRYNQAIQPHLKQGLIIAQKYDFYDLGVEAVFDGRIIAINDNKTDKDCGRSVVIQTESLKAFYCFLSEINEELEIDRIVEAGEIVGYLGETLGFSNPHFYLMIKVSDINVDPYLFLKGGELVDYSWLLNTESGIEYDTDF